MISITIKTENKRRFFIPIPTLLVTNPLAMHFIKKHIKIEGFDPNHIKRLVRELKRFKQENGRFELVNIESQDGTKIKITI
jgi:hypothetical protein